MATGGKMAISQISTDCNITSQITAECDSWDISENSCSTGQDEDTSDKTIDVRFESDKTTITVCNPSKILAPLLRSSVLSSTKYTKTCLQLEMDLYKIFQENRDINSTTENKMLYFLKAKFRHIFNNGYSDHAFAVLLFGYDILSHYGFWDTKKMGDQLRIAFNNLKKGMPKNKLYFESAICQELCYQALLKNKFGKATFYIQRAQQCIQFLEPCEWTSWVYQMQGMIYWNLTEIHRKSSDVLFEETGKAFLLCREHILRAYTQTGIHAKYCAVWALLRTAKAKLKLPWFYDTEVLSFFIEEKTTSLSSIEEMTSLLSCAVNEIDSLGHLPVYFENLSAEICELKMFSSVRMSQIKENECIHCGIKWTTTALQQLNNLFENWNFPDQHMEGLLLVQNYMKKKENILELKQNKKIQMGIHLHSCEIKSVCLSIANLSSLSDSLESV